MPTNLIEIVQAQSWAIVPEKLDAIHQVLAAHAAGRTIEYDAATPGDSEADKPYRIIDRVAVIPIHGVIAKRMNLMQEFSGGTSSEIVGRDIRAALADSEVRAIVLDMDSPGGTVDGTEALAEIVYEAREVKPIVVFANGLMASAGYWIGSGAQRIITNQTGEIGSIGVVMAHYDYSEANEKAGVKRTYIYAGKYKTIGNDSEPLSKEGEAYLQAGVDYVYSLFIETVSRNRGCTIADTLAMAEGKIFIGQQALDIGLVDEIGNFETALETARSMGVEQFIFGYKPGAKSPTKQEGDTMPKEKTGSSITLDRLEAEAPDLVAEIRSDAIASVDPEPARAEGATAERDNILALATVHFGEDPAKSFAAIVTSGASVEMYSAMKSAMPEAKKPEGEKPDKMGEMLDVIKKSGADNPGAGAGASGPRNFSEAWTAIKAETKCSTEVAMKQAVRKYPDLHKSFIGQAGNA